MKKKHIGSTLENLLEKGGAREDVYADAIKRVVALQLREAMKRKGRSG